MIKEAANRPAASVILHPELCKSLFQAILLTSWRLF
jgi:hypothetical protein